MRLRMNMVPMANNIVKSAFLAGIAGLCLCASPFDAGAAARIEVSKGDCKSGVHLVARDARLSDVLRQLSTTLDFQFRFEGERDPAVDIDISRQPVELIAKLAADENVVVTQARDRSCPNRDRLVKVWVLPKGVAGAPRKMPPPTPPPVDPEQQKAYEQYLEAHGMRLGPDGREETIPLPKK
jgi:hypothetical protein